MEQTGNNFFHVFIDGNEIGATYSESHARNLINQARRNIMMRSEEIIFIDADMVITGEEVMWGVTDSDEEIIGAAEKLLSEDIVETMQRGYSVKVNDFIVNLADEEQVKALFAAVKDKYDPDDLFHVELVADDEHGFHTFTIKIVQKDEVESEAIPATSNRTTISMEGGVEKYLADSAQITVDKELDFSDYKLGIREMNFVQDIEIAETYLPIETLGDLGAAISKLTMEEEKPVEYEVEKGDTLGKISLKVGIPMEDIVSLNSDALKSVNSIINIGQKLIITVPEPTLSVSRVEERYVEEIYDADVIYIDKKEWYTHKTNVVQQPSAGFRKIVADIHYLNEEEVSREILKEEIVKEAVPMIMERGTKVPPTYIKPISGGVITSGFGYRDIKLAGATKNHVAIDWGVPVGTSVYASCGGKVVKAGWVEGYGYCVFIDHEDGRQTRYAHLSKILVSTGQYVKQGQKIALSGSTGRTTGPHLHFEMRINGVAVNPLLYIQ